MKPINMPKREGESLEMCVLPPLSPINIKSLENATLYGVDGITLDPTLKKPNATRMLFWK